MDEELGEKSEHEEQESAGKWVNRHMGQNLGGKHGDLEFTVIGWVAAFNTCLENHWTQKIL
jgi:hypothetical protein